MTDNNLLTVEEAARFLHISKSHLYKLTSSGKVKHYKPGGKNLYFIKSDLMEYVLSGDVKTADEIEQEAINIVTA